MRVFGSARKMCCGVRRDDIVESSFSGDLNERQLMRKDASNSGNRHDVFLDFRRSGSDTHG